MNMNEKTFWICISECEIKKGKISVSRIYTSEKEARNEAQGATHLQIVPITLLVEE